MGDPDDIRAWQRLDALTTTSGRIEAGDVARLAAIGVRHVVNLALADHPEALPDEAERLAAAGIRYTHIPVPFDAPREEHFAAFRAALVPGEQTHVHCIMNWRVSTFFFRLNRDHRGMPAEEARALMNCQWVPEASDHPSALPWKDFIA